MQNERAERTGESIGNLKPSGHLEAVADERKKRYEKPGVVASLRMDEALEEVNRAGVSRRLGAVIGLLVLSSASK